MQDDPNKQDDTTYTEENDDKKHQQVKSPAIQDEENPLTGDATSSEPVDIDEELKAVGLKGDYDQHGNEEPKPIDAANELLDDEKNQ